MEINNLFTKNFFIFYLRFICTPQVRASPDRPDGKDLPNLPKAFRQRTSSGSCPACRTAAPNPFAKCLCMVRQQAVREPFPNSRRRYPQAGNPCGHGYPSCFSHITLILMQVFRFLHDTASKKLHPLPCSRDRCAPHCMP